MNKHIILAFSLMLLFSFVEASVSVSANKYPDTITSAIIRLLKGNLDKRFLVVDVMVSLVHNFQLCVPTWRKLLCLWGFVCP